MSVSFGVGWGSFNFGHATGRRSLEVLPATDGSQQSRWITTGIGNNFLETANPKRARSVLKQRYSHAEEFHRKLWPGIQVPNITGDNSSKDVATASTMPTSLMVAYIGLMISQQKRSVKFRQRAFELLKAFVDRLAVCSPTLDFLMCDADGVCGWQTQTMSTGHACVPWTKQFFQRHLQMTWLNDLSNPNIPWVTSYPVEGQIHLADWIAFSLDFPAWVANKRANKEILWAKQVIERSALSVLTQLAALIESNLTHITTSLDPSVRMKFKRVPKEIKWGFVSNAMEMLFAQQESRLKWPASFSKK